MFTLNKKTVVLSAGLALLSVNNVFADGISTHSTYDWTGVYLGGYIGGASGSDVSSSEPYNATSSNFWNNTGLNNNYSTNASFIGGGTVGYNWQIPHSSYVVGVEGEYGYIGSNGSQNDPNAPFYNANLPQGVTIPSNAVSSVKVGNSYGYGLIGSRIGYSIDRALLYVKGGALFTSTQSSFTDSNYGATSVVNKDTTGYAVGTGVEYALPFEATKNMSVKAEYLYFGLDSKLSNSFDNGGGATYVSNTSINGIHTAKVGLNYKF